MSSLAGADKCARNLRSTRCWSARCLHLHNASHRAEVTDKQTQCGLVTSFHLQWRITKIDTGLANHADSEMAQETFRPLLRKDVASRVPYRNQAAIAPLARCETR